MEKTCSGIGTSSIWPAGSIWKGKEDKRLLTCRAHSPDLDNLNTMWLDARYIWFMMSLVFRGSHPAPVNPMCSVLNAIFHLHLESRISLSYRHWRPAPPAMVYNLQLKLWPPRIRPP